MQCSLSNICSFLSLLMLFHSKLPFLAQPSLERLTLGSGAHTQTTPRSLQQQKQRPGLWSSSFGWFFRRLVGFLTLPSPPLVIPGAPHTPGSGSAQHKVLMRSAVNLTLGDSAHRGILWLLIVKGISECKVSDGTSIGRSGNRAGGWVGGYLCPPEAATPTWGQIPTGLLLLSQTPECGLEVLEAA